MEPHQNVSRHEAPNQADEYKGHHGHRRRHSDAHQQEDSGLLLTRKHDWRRESPHGHASSRAPTIPERAMSGDNDYVRKWLAQTQDKTVAYGLGRRQSHSPPKYQANAPPSRHAHHPPRHRELNAIDTARLRPKAKRRRKSSSDSSLLKPVAKPKRPSPSKQHGSNDAVGQRISAPDRSRKRQKIQSSDIELSAGSSVRRTQPETFEKRQRHKTREDRYEPEGKAKGPAKNSTGQVSTSKRQKRGARKRGANKAGENLMRNFASKSIGQDRVTLQPSSGLGIFKNGRASSPNIRRGLPDLAFSEMDFLQRSKSNPSKDNEKVTSKYRGREQRKVFREQEEISAFFKPSKTPLKERSINSEGRGTKDGAEDAYSLHSKPTATDGYSSSRMNSVGPSVNLQDQLSRLREESRPSCDTKFSSRQQNSALDYSEHHPGNTSGRSEQATTYLTWSETQYTPMQTASDHDMESDSPTPDFVRTCIKNTGIFKDTGVSPHSGLRQPRRNRRGTSHRRHYSPNVTDERNEGFVECNTSTTVPSVDGSQRLSRQPHGKGILNDDHSERLPLRRPTESRVPINTNDDQSSTIEQAGNGVTVDMYDREKGWARYRNIRESKSTPISRQEITKRARIKRPVTVLPVTTSNAQQTWRRRDNLAGAHSTIQSAHGLIINASSSHDSLFQLGPASDFLEAQDVSNKEAYQDCQDDKNSQNWDPVSAEQHKLDASQGHEYTIAPAITVVKANPQSILKPESFGTTRGEPFSGNWTSSVRAATTSAYGLPQRGSSGASSMQLPIQHKRWSPSVDVAIEPLYARQMQPPQGKGQKQVHFAAELSTGPFQGDFDTLSQSNTQYDDVVDDDLFEDSYLVESTELEGFYQETSWDDVAMRPRQLNTVAPDTTNLLKSEEGFSYRPDLESHETWNENEQNSYRQHATHDGLYGQDFDEAYGMEDTSLQYDDQGNDDQGSIRGFWQPRRQY